MINEANKRKFKEIEKKFNKIAPFFLFTVIATIVVVVVILSSHYVKKDIEQYSIRNKEVYTYIGGQKFTFKGKITLNRKNNVTDLELDGGRFELGREPLYVVGESTVIFPSNMSVVFPYSSLAQSKINYFTVLDGSSGQAVLSNTNLNNYILQSGFIFDGNNIYFFIKDTKLVFGDKSIDISAYSFVDCQYKGALEIFDYSKQTSTVYEDVKEDAYVVEKDYKINLTHDSIEIGDTSVLLIKDIDKLGNLK